MPDAAARAHVRPAVQGAQAPNGGGAAANGAPAPARGAAAPAPPAPPAWWEALWRAENVEFTTVGIDIGSATSHLQFSRVRLQRCGRGLSSRFAVVDRSALYRSPVIFTPYLTDGSIDSAALGRFAESERAAAGLAPRQVDSGAVILTGEAAASQNARPLAVALAEHAGVFVCATAGHHLEAKLAAHGSGAAALSAKTGQVVAHLDIGGGTTKLALLRGGRVLATAAVAVGGRLLVFDRSGRLAWVSEAGARLARAVGVEPAPGVRSPPRGAAASPRKWPACWYPCWKTTFPPGIGRCC